MDGRSQVSRDEFESLKADYEQLKGEFTELKLSRLQKTIRKLKANKRIVLLVLFGLILLPMAVYAFTVPNIFVAGTPTVAADVNANFDAIANSLTAMEGKSWRLIYETDLVSATTNINVTGLNGNADKVYMVLARFVNTTGAGASYYLQPNGEDATFGYLFVGGSGGPPGSGNATSPGFYICSALASTSCEITGTVYAQTGAARVFIAQQIYSVTPGNVGGFQNVATSWSNTGSNITSLTVFASTNSMGAGSHIEIWGRR